MEFDRVRDLDLGQLNQWTTQAIALTQQGRVPDYIPQLAQVDREGFAACIQSHTGYRCDLGQTERRFVLMSVVKPFLLLYLLEHDGADTVFAYTARQPSSYPFNSLEQLNYDHGFPRNPMLNSGAIALSALLPGNDPMARCEALRQWLYQRAGVEFVLDRKMLASVQSRANERNRALAKRIAQAGYLCGSVNLALATYEYICCLAGTVVDLAQAGLLLTGKQGDTTDQSTTVRQVMATCGLYEQSEAFMQAVGLPSKSGVSGALISIVPGEGAIACYSPPLDSTGNPIAALWFVQRVAQALQPS